MSEQTTGQKMLAALRQSGKSAALAARYGVSTVRVMLQRHDTSSVFVTARLSGRPTTAEDLLDRLRRAVSAWSQTEDGKATLAANKGACETPETQNNVNTSRTQNHSSGLWAY